MRGINRSKTRQKVQMFSCHSNWLTFRKVKTTTNQRTLTERGRRCQRIIKNRTQLLEPRVSQTEFEACSYSVARNYERTNDLIESRLYNIITSKPNLLSSRKSFTRTPATRASRNYQNKHHRKTANNVRACNRTLKYKRYILNILLRILLEIIH